MPNYNFRGRGYLRGLGSGTFTKTPVLSDEHLNVTRDEAVRGELARVIPGVRNQDPYPLNGDRTEWALWFKGRPFRIGWAWQPKIDLSTFWPQALGQGQQNNVRLIPPKIPIRGVSYASTVLGAAQAQQFGTTPAKIPSLQVGSIGLYG